MNPHYELRIVELLTAILEEQRAQRRLLEERRLPGPAEAKYAGLVAAIREHAKDRIFSARELVEFAELEPSGTLSAAIVASAGSLNARKVGRALRRAEGLDFGGLVVLRVGSDSSGVSWRVRVSGRQNPETRVRVA